MLLFCYKQATLLAPFILFILGLATPYSFHISQLTTVEVTPTGEQHDYTYYSYAVFSV